MADQRHAVNRIRYLIGDGPYQATPKTITREGDAILSYDLVIADKWTGSWEVWTELIGQDVKPPDRTPHATKSAKSPTTNRHIRAAAEALRGK